MILAAGGLVTLSLVLAHYFSPVSRRLAAGEDVKLVLLNRERPMLFVYHPFSRTVNAIRMPGKAARGGSAYQRAGEVLKLFPEDGSAPRNGGLADTGSPENPAYIEAETSELDSFEDLIGNWRARPERLLRLGRYLCELKRSEASNLSAYEMTLLALELIRLKASDLIKEDFEKTPAREAFAAESGPGPLPGGAAQAPAAARLEILNASGKKDLAGSVTRYLRKRGFDVINFGTYGSVERQTKIVNCSDSIEAARLVRDALGLGGLEIYSKADRRGIVQVRVILGSDFEETGGLK
ncbi:MAG: hypothetical protein A2X28_00930 [Elusimicrobia bacterium GWA2_56_46]|nr:MAG: hypothetical protein A2X28_00930 [Elusimicrobia bacterium GWA2_56_46]OGR55927.1 MAG: hypothetical protein A2X39_06295 [Elusimicrobia bacterium GWC2_56_31]